MSDTEAATSSTEAIADTSNNAEKMDEIAEPESKRRKLTKNNEIDVKKNRLEDRLGGILCCAVCLDLPRAAVYQVSHHFVTLLDSKYVCSNRIWGQITYCLQLNYC